jgi:uncharacterized protein (TIGR03437 family)
MRSAAKFVIFLSLAFVVKLSPGVCADLSIPLQVGGQGASILVPVSFASHGESVSGLQFDLSFDDSAMSLAAVVGEAARSSTKTLHVAALNSNRYRFLITEFNDDVISDGDVVELFVSVKPGAALGKYSIRFQSAIATDPSGQPVASSTSDGTLSVEAVSSAPVLLQGVLNAASLQAGAVVPGEIITIMGSGLATQGVPGNVSFDGLLAPLLYVSSNQINAVVPFGIAGRDSTTMEVADSSGALAHIVIPVAESAPGVFTLTGSGSGGGAVLNQDGTVNTPANPAHNGLIVVLFATGAGQTTPAGIDGLIPVTVLPKPKLPVSVQLGGLAAEVLYAGAAPGLISGVLQVNCRVPMEIEASWSVPVLLRVGEVTSPPVTIAVR